MKILFVCRANAGRSQMAEAFYNALTHSKNSSSAGVDLPNSTVGNDPHLPPLVKEIMEESGLNMDAARRKWITEDAVKECDMAIVIMEEGEFPLPEYLEKSPKFVRWDGVPDAKGHDLAFHRTVRDKIYDKVLNLIAQTGGV